MSHVEASVPFQTRSNLIYDAIIRDSEDNRCQFNDEGLYSIKKTGSTLLATHVEITPGQALLKMLVPDREHKLVIVIIFVVVVMVVVVVVVIAFVIVSLLLLMLMLLLLLW